MNTSINLGRIRKALVALRQAERELEAVVLSDAERLRSDPDPQPARKGKRRSKRGRQ